MFNYICILLEVWGEDEGLYDMYNMSLAKVNFESSS